MSKKTAALGCSAGAILSPIFLYGCVKVTQHVHGQVLDRGKYKYDTVAYEWADGIDPNGATTYKQFYGAHIYTVKRSSGFDVYCEVSIGGPRSTGMKHNCGHLGHVEDPREARELWGRITWTPTELIVGDPDHAGIAVPRAKIQRHR